MAEKLNILLKTSLALSEQFQTTLDTAPPAITSATAENATTSTATTSSQAHTDPLILMSNSVKTLRAQVTKLSLLSITAPFTPSALLTSLTPVNDSVMPSMVTAALMLTPIEYTKPFASEARILSKTVLKEFSVLVEEITTVAHKLSDKDKKEELSKSEKGVITSQTGRVWDVCDSITALVTQGVVGHVVRRVQEWHDLMKDAISELEEWDPEDDDVDFEDMLGIEDEDKVDAKDKNTKKNKSSTQSKEEHDDDDKDDDDDDIEALRKQKKSLLRALKPIAQIYPAIVSNRLKKGGLMATKPQIAKLESLTSELQSIPNHVDEAAGSLYESNLDDCARYLNMAKATAERAIELITFPWDAGSSSNAAEQKQAEDKFTVWSRTWKKVIGDVIKDIQL